MFIAFVCDALDSGPDENTQVRCRTLLIFSNYVSLCSMRLLAFQVTSSVQMCNFGDVAIFNIALVQRARQKQLSRSEFCCVRVAQQCIPFAWMGMPRLQTCAATLVQNRSNAFSNFLMVSARLGYLRGADAISGASTASNWVNFAAAGMFLHTWMSLFRVFRHVIHPDLISFITAFYGARFV